MKIRKEKIKIKMILAFKRDNLNIGILKKKYYLVKLAYLNLGLIGKRYLVICV